MTRRRIRLQETASNRGAGIFECASYLGVTESKFVQNLPALQARGFPTPHPILGTFDIDAVNRWLDKESGLVATLADLGSRHREKVREWGKSG